MRNAESVTFGGSDLDRMAHRRAAPDLLAPGPGERAETCVIWRGKALCRGAVEGGPLSLLRLPMDHPMLKADPTPPAFLGKLDDRLIFAKDLSAWQPVEPVDEAQIGAFADRSTQHHPLAPEDSGFFELRSVMTRLAPRDAELAVTARALFVWHRNHRFCARCGQASDVADAGWKRLCPACGTQHFPRTDPVVIMLITRGDRVLVGRSPGWPDRMYSLLAGFVEPGETVEAAVRREVFEESAIRVGEVTYLASQPWPYPSSLMIGCHGEALTDEITVDPNELEDAIWLTRQDLLEVFAGTHPAVAGARPGAIAHFLLERWLADDLD